MKFAGRVILFCAALTTSAPSAFAQAPGPLEQGGGLVWGSVGFQGDLGGGVNSSGVGVVNGLRAEIDTNTWGERYDAAFIFRIGGAYNLTSYSQVFGALAWEQAEADTTEIGLIGGLPLLGKFGDYQGWGFDVGYRYFFNSDYAAKPFVAGSVGYQRVQDITLSLTSTPFNVADVPFYDDSWVVGWRLGTGILVDINDHFGWQVTIDLKYAGELSDQSGIGTLGFERINDVGNRWTLPIMGGVYYKF
jgi:hypothetical protein